MIIDTQIHLWEAATPERPWRADRPMSLPEPFGPEQFLPMMDEAGVERAIIVPPGTMDTNSDFALECVAAYPDRFAVMGLVDVLNPDADNLVKHWLEQPGMLGFRTHAHRDERQRWGSVEAPDPFWAACERYQVPVMLFLAGAIGLAGRIVEKFPDLRLVIDHVGGLAGTPEQAQVTVDRLVELAKYPKVVVKLSTLPFRSKVGYPFPEVHDIARQVFEAFGPQRSMWGSDHTQIMARNLGTYVEQVDLFRKAVDFLSDSDRDWVLGRAASEYLGWPPGVPSTAVAHPKS